jgi:hypothetical protein
MNLIVHLSVKSSSQVSQREDCSCVGFHLPIALAVLAKDICPRST